jgi:hypothetical protein
MRRRFIIHNTRDAVPEGPYHSSWASNPRWIVQTAKGVFIVQEGQQPEEGIPQPDLRTARWQLKREGFKAKDTVGSAEEVAYGEGYHAERNVNPYSEPALKAAWERGRAAAKLAGKFRGNYYKGEIRNKRFQPPRQQDARKSAARQAVELTYEEDGKRYKRNFTSNTELEEWLRKNPQATMISRVMLVQRDTDPEGFAGFHHQQDFKSERGFQAKVFSSTGGLVAQSPVFLNESKANRWLQERIEQAIKAGFRVTGKVFPGFFDPAMVAA